MSLGVIYLTRGFHIIKNASIINSAPSGKNVFLYLQRALNKALRKDYKPLQMPYTYPAARLPFL